MRIGKWFRVPKPLDNPKLRLICLPYAGGNSNSYMKWAEQLPDGIELVAVELPGRSARMLETPYDEMHGLVDDLYEAFQPFLNIPYVLFGHSLGGRIAYEMMLRSQQRQQPLAQHLIVSASRAPHVIKRRHDIYHLSDDEFIEEMRDFNGTPERVLQDREFMELLLPMLKADFKIADQYISPPLPVASPVTVIGSTGDDHIIDEHLWAWDELSPNKVEVAYVEGAHFYLDTHPQQVLAVVNEVLLNLEEK